MLKTRIIAADITNLTDARYFAAWGADYMSFCMGEGSDTYVAPPTVKEIVGWIEGPRPLLQFKSSKQDEAYVSWMMESCDVGGAVIGSGVKNTTVLGAEPLLAFKEVHSQQDLEDLEGITGIIVRNATVDYIRFDGGVFLDYELSVDQIQELLDADRLPGLVLRGGEEQQVGVKEYHDLDQIIEVLEED